MKIIRESARCVVAWCALWGVSGGVQADALSRIRQTQTITLAHREASIPFSYLDENRKPVGYALDLCLRIADAVKRELKLPQLKVQYLAVSPSTRIPAIVQGKADLECGSTTNNAERRQQVVFTIPHFISGVRMLVRSDANIGNWSDLHGRNVVTTKGTTTVKFLDERNRARALDLHVTEAKDHDESFHFLATGKVDAFAMDDVLLFGFRANAPHPEQYKVTGDQLSVEAFAIMMNKTESGLKSIADREMARLIGSGELEKFYSRWFLQPIPPRNINLNMPMGFLLRESLRFPSDRVAD